MNSISGRYSVFDADGVPWRVNRMTINQRIPNEVFVAHKLGEAKAELERVKMDLVAKLAYDLVHSRALTFHEDQDLLSDEVVVRISIDVLEEK